MINLPNDYKTRMQKLLGDEFADYEAALNKPPVKAFRVNTNKITLTDFEKINPFGTDKISYVEGGYYLDYEKVGNHPFHHAGLIYMQEPAAMMPAECIDISPDSFVLDMCAAPGGKSTQLKAKLNDNGLLVSNEIVPSRCKILAGNIERMGFKNHIVTCLDTSRLASLFKNTFDVVMVDAPCSGEGMFRKEKVALSEWSTDNVLKCAVRQRNILENAAKCLASGGYIIYATCTFSLQENEMVLDDFLSDHPEFELMPVKQAVQSVTCDGIFFDGCRCKSIHFARRFYPHKALGEGQFAAVIHHKGEKMPHLIIKKAPQKIDSTLISFLNDTLIDYNQNDISFCGNRPVFFGGNFDVPQGTAFMLGVTVGEIKKNYILPHHQFFMAFGNQFKRKIELAPDSAELQKYLHGEEIPTTCQNGWAAVTVCGAAVGGVKVVNGIAKNHYPKGLRILK